MMDDYVINDEQPMRGTLIDAIRVIREYINRPPEPENILIGTKTGTIVTSDDAFPAIPKGAKAYGKSTQDGTPTPEAPVPILSVDDLTLHVCGKNVFDSSLLLESQYSSFDGEYYTVSGYYLGVAFKDGFPAPIYGRQVTVSFDGMNETGTEDTNGLNFIFVYTDNTLDSVKVHGLTLSHYSLVSNPNKTIKLLRFSYNSNVNALLKNIQLEFGDTATNYEPYSCTTIPIPLSNNSARSLPDGTRDTLTLSYVAPSTEHEGWGVFGAELVQYTNTYTVQANLITGTSDIGGGYVRGFIYAGLPHASTSNTGYCTHAPYLASGTVQSDHAYVVGQTVVLIVSGTTLADLQAAYDGAELVYHLATPITHDLGTIELPILPAPNFTFFANGGNAQPDVQILYERDITIVIDKLEAAETPVGTLGISPAINHSFEPSIQTQEETEWQSDSI